MFRELLNMFLLFFRIGAVTFGGGYAMLPILQRELVENRDWTTEEELADTLPSASVPRASLP